MHRLFERHNREQVVVELEKIENEAEDRELRHIIREDQEFESVLQEAADVRELA